jgi:hypothetical protein
MLPKVCVEFTDFCLDCKNGVTFLYTEEERKWLHIAFKLNKAKHDQKRDQIGEKKQAILSKEAITIAQA